LKINSEILGKERKILIYTPWEYDHMPDSRFEVIYVFDAQARQYFDNVHSTYAFLNQDRFPMIVVGIVSEERNKDFLPESENPGTYEHYGGYLGNAGLFLSFINNELVPYIEKNYRTLPKRIAVGHSNGATFITYCLLHDPALFDAYITISPNFAYDEEQMVKKLQNFDPGRLKSRKFFYMCNSNEGEKWVIARGKVIRLFESARFKKKFVFVNQDFSATENHSTVFPLGVFYGLKHYLNDQFFNASNLIAYYSDLYKSNLVRFTPDELNQIGYNFFYSGQTAEALKILLWANQLFPDDLNLYDSIGEMYQNLDNKPEAMKYYNMFKQKLNQRKSSMPEEEYKRLKKNIDGRLSYLKSMN
jgi:predicted alpha/beta superfamily hydrolase